MQSRESTSNLFTNQLCAESDARRNLSLQTEVCVFLESPRRLSSLDLSFATFLSLSHPRAYRIRILSFIRMGKLNDTLLPRAFRTPSAGTRGTGSLYGKRVRRDLSDSQQPILLWYRSAVLSHKDEDFEREKGTDDERRGNAVRGLPRSSWIRYLPSRARARARQALI